MFLLSPAFKDRSARFAVDGGRALAIVLAGMVCAGTAQAQTPVTPPPAGHMRAVTAQRAVTPPVIDGLVNEPAWNSGAVADDFWVSQRDQPPSDPTRVVVLYDDHALYFAFTCLDGRPDLIRANQITRDTAPGFDDRVTVELDPFHNHRSVSRFTVTARGTQSDVLAGGRARTRGWKGQWTAAARRTPFGWTAEIAIPIGLLEFEPGSGTFGINFSRYQNRTREWSEWANLTPQRLGEEAGHLTGLRLPQPSASGRLAVMHYLVGGLSSADGNDRARRWNGGVDIRYQWKRAITSVVSARPDFSGIESDAPAVVTGYSEQFVRDRRPFFQEGGEFFGDREVFHSGRIEQFDLAAKTFGRIEDYQVGVLAIADAGSGRTDYVGHVVREIGPTFNLSATAAATNQPVIDNTTVQLKAGGRVGRHVQVKGTVARTSTDGAQPGIRGRGEFGYSTDRWSSTGWVDYTDSEYFPADGFLAADVIGTSGHGAYGGYTHTFDRARMRRAGASVSFDARETTSGLRQRAMTSIYIDAETASNIQLNAGITVGEYRPRHTGQNGWADRVNQDHSSFASAFYQSPTGQFGYGAQYSWGVAGEQDYGSVSPSAWLSPNPHLSFAYSFERAADQAVQHQHVVSGTWEITGGQSLAGRWVDYDGGYYRLSYRRTLARSIDAFGTYASAPYSSEGFMVKLVWTLLR